MSNWPWIICFAVLFCALALFWIFRDRVHLCAKCNTRPPEEDSDLCRICAGQARWAK